MTLARVSVLRGEGSRTGVPFIDDHILTLEPIADYLTEFSGIRRTYTPPLGFVTHTKKQGGEGVELMVLPLVLFILSIAGDLDQNSSPHTLVPLKVAYKKLRLLVDLGCIFIGHGLSKDFRIISQSPSARPPKKTGLQSTVWR
jgi:PAB-dependent poly(A)-specific ribonuclease subunit 2